MDNGEELMEVEKEAICGKKMIVFTIHGSKGPKKYLIGVQISKILHRQTFNLYRSLKLKGVEVERASPPQVGFLLRTQSLPPNTHSVSLVPYDGGKDFIIDNWKGEEVRKIPSCSTSRMGNLGPRKWSNQSPQPAKPTPPTSSSSSSSSSSAQLFSSLQEHQSQSQSSQANQSIPQSPQEQQLPSSRQQAALLPPRTHCHQMLFRPHSPQRSLRRGPPQRAFQFSDTNKCRSDSEGISIRMKTEQPLLMEKRASLSRVCLTNSLDLPQSVTASGPLLREDFWRRKISPYDSSSSETEQLPGLFSSDSEAEILEQNAVSSLIHLSSPPSDELKNHQKNGVFGQAPIRPSDFFQVPSETAHPLLRPPPPRKTLPPLTKPLEEDALQEGSGEVVPPTTLPGKGEHSNSGASRKLDLSFLLS